ncbi:hypothetical protein PSI15_10240, partial [Xenorhabdus sp. PR6a]|uniref:hypothetical protein n=1 Tax=Xenorhabdus sp. PR6a TaxID=3025877 RepID=UPI002358A818
GEVGYLKNPPNSPAIAINNDNITFLSLASVDITAVVTKSNKTQYKYTYKTDPQRQFIAMNNKYPNASDANGNSENCESTGAITPIRAELMSSGSGTALIEEYNNPYNFGFLDDFKLTNQYLSDIKMLETRPAQGNYLLFSTFSGIEDPLGGNPPKGFVVCVENKK